MINHIIYERDNSVLYKQWPAEWHVPLCDNWASFWQYGRAWAAYFNVDGSTLPAFNPRHNASLADQNPDPESFAESFQKQYLPGYRVLRQMPENVARDVARWFGSDPLQLNANGINNSPKVVQAMMRLCEKTRKIDEIEIEPNKHNFQP